MDNDYTLYWKDGKREFVAGQTIADAMNKAGYGASAVRALSFYAFGKEDFCEYDPVRKDWFRKQVNLAEIPPVQATPSH